MQGYPGVLVSFFHILRDQCHRVSAERDLGQKMPASFTSSAMDILEYQHICFREREESF